MPMRPSAATRRHGLCCGVALAALMLPTLAAAQSTETRFTMRNGSAVCGTILGEQGINMTVQTPNGLQVILRRDQVLRRVEGACETAAPAAAAPPPAPAQAAAPAAPAPAPAQAAAPPRPAAPAPAPTATAAAASPYNLRFAGSTTMGERMVPDLVDAFIASLSLQARGWAPGDGANERMQEARGPNGRVLRTLIAVSGGQGAMAALIANRTDLAMASRPPSPEELTAYRAAYNLDANAVPQEVVLALDGLAVIVHAENPIQSLSLDQIRDIYAGQVTNWSQLGGPNLPIRLNAREAESAAWGLFNQVVMRRRAAATGIERNDTDSEISSAVAAEAGSIGLVPFAFIGENRALNLTASCGIEFETSEFSIKTEDYPLARRNFLLASPRASETAGEFTRFASAPSAYEIIQDAGYASMAPQLGTREYTTYRLLDATRAAPASPDARYAEAMLQYNIATRASLRLSTTFRFVAGSAQLDARGTEDIERVAEFLRRPENQQYRVRVLGFTDAGGAFGQNRAISERRAGEVGGLLRARGVTITQARGLGPIAPVACDDDPDAAIRNRRVEIWLGTR